MAVLTLSGALLAHWEMRCAQIAGGRWTGVSGSRLEHVEASQKGPPSDLPFDFRPSNASGSLVLACQSAINLPHFDPQIIALTRSCTNSSQYATGAVLCKQAGVITITAAQSQVPRSADARSSGCASISLSSGARICELIDRASASSQHLECFDSQIHDMATHFINVDLSLAFNPPCSSVIFLPDAGQLQNQMQYLNQNLDFWVVILVNGEPSGPYGGGGGGTIQNEPVIGTGDLPLTRATKCGPR